MESIKVNIVLEKEGQKQFPISIKQNLHQTVSEEIKLNEIISHLKQQNFTDFFESSISYYDSTRKMYIFCFYLPKNITIDTLKNQHKYTKTIPLAALNHQGNELYLKLKFRKRNKTKLQLLKDEQFEKYDNIKQKQKTIADVIEKVALWRKLYTGFQDEKDMNLHLQLDASAKEIGIVKKTLDDYLLQIRNGKKYGFNFHKRKSDKIGDLRSFVRDKKQQSERKDD